MFQDVKPIITILSIILLLLFIYGLFSRKIPIDYNIWTKKPDHTNIKLVYIIDRNIKNIIDKMDSPELKKVYDEKMNFGYWYH